MKLCSVGACGRESNHRTSTVYIPKHTLNYHLNFAASNLALEGVFVLLRPLAPHKSSDSIVHH